MEKLAVLVKKETLTEPLLHSLLKLFVARISKRRFLCIFGGAKAFVLERTYTLLNIYHKNGVHCGIERIEENGRCAARVGAKLHRDS
jgi:hypothetical protein